MIPSANTERFARAALATSEDPFNGPESWSARYRV